LKVSPHSLSFKEYAGIAILILAVGIVLLLLFVGFSPALVPADISGEFYYIVLIVWGLICALCYWGLFKGYARVTYRHLGFAVDLGGGIAVVALVVIGGHVLPRHHETFDVTLRAHSASEALIRKGSIRMELGGAAQVAEIGSNGDADFKGISARFMGAEVRILPMVDGYEQEYQTVKLTSEVVNINLRGETSLFTLQGQLEPTPPVGRIVTVLVEGAEPVSPDRYGRFTVLVHRKPGDVVRVNVCADGHRVHDDFHALVNTDVVIATHPSKVSCNN
jgi:hypothetical protein